MPAIVNKSKPSLGHMVECFSSYLKATGKTSATFKQVVMSKDGLGWTGTYSEWLNGNHFHNKNMILKWQEPKIEHAWRFKKTRRGYYFPTRGNSSKFRFRRTKTVPTVTVSTAKTDTPVQMELPFTDTAFPEVPANVKGVLIVPVTSIDRFHHIVDQLKGVLDDPDHDFLAALLNCGNA